MSKTFTSAEFDFVPREPTKEMLEAAEYIYYNAANNFADDSRGTLDMLGTLYKAMLAVAPESPESPASAVDAERLLATLNLVKRGLESGNVTAKPIMDFSNLEAKTLAPQSLLSIIDAAISEGTPK